MGCTENLIRTTIGDRWTFVVHTQRRSIHGEWFSRTEQEALADLSGFVAVSLCQDLSNSELSTGLLSSAMNLCIAKIPGGGSSRYSKLLRGFLRFRLRASTCFNRRLWPGFR